MTDASANDRNPPWSPAGARAFCRRLARSHYENFTVASWLLPRTLRQHFFNIYAYCRCADDFADEPIRGGDFFLIDTCPSRRLDWWEQQLNQCYEGQASHPVFIALMETIREYDIPRQPFLDLLAAFRQDQVRSRYETFVDVLDYCKCSANPVGRLVLHLGRCATPENLAYADSICTGLQLANFCQDVASDFDRGRIYLPSDDCRRFGYEESMFARREYNPHLCKLMAFQVQRADSYLNSGWPLVDRVPRTLRIDVALFIRGGFAILDEIRRADYDIWTRRPTVSRAKKLTMLAGVLCDSLLSRDRR